MRALTTQDQLEKLMLVLDKWDEADKIIAAYTAQNEALKIALEALEFYANENNYNHYPATSDPECGIVVGFIEEEVPGGIGRKALDQVNKILERGRE